VTIRSAPRVFVCRVLPGGALDALRRQCDVEVWPEDAPPSTDALREAVRGCHGVVTLLTDRVDAELLDSAPDLAVVSNVATGFDNVDVDACSERAVLVTRTPGVLAETTAEFALALLFSAARRVVEGDRFVREGRWETWSPTAFLGTDIAGSTLGIIGLGGIGAEVAKRARALGMRVIYTSRTRQPGREARLKAEYVALEQLLREADFVSLHAPLTPQTRGMIGVRELGLMKPHAVLVNTARGSLVDPKALYTALRSGRIAAAALDVTDPEPIPTDDPLLTLDNCIVTPHIASATVATRSRMAMLAAENLLRALRGEVPKNAVNRSVARRWKKRISAFHFPLSA
jgi:lactate dehydrogenase-like 2-hydroxyacid dehydrogenase